MHVPEARPSFAQPRPPAHAHPAIGRGTSVLFAALLLFLPLRASAQTTRPQPSTRPATAQPTTQPATQPVPRPAAPFWRLFDNRGGGRGRDRSGPSFGIETFETVKPRIGASDEEWKVIRPLLRKITTERRILYPADAASPFRFGGPDNFMNAGHPILEAQKDLQAALDDPASTKELLQERVQSLREARARCHADLARLEEELRDLVPPEAQAVLVDLGYLD